MYLFFDLAKTNPFLALLMFALACGAVVAPFRYAFLAYNRRLRSANIRSQGWPPPHVDADGDAVVGEE